MTSKLGITTDGWRIIFNRIIRSAGDFQALSQPAWSSGKAACSELVNFTVQTRQIAAFWCFCGVSLQNSRPEMILFEKYIAALPPYCISLLRHHGTLIGAVGHNICVCCFPIGRVLPELCQRLFQSMECIDLPWRVYGSMENVWFHGRQCAMEWLAPWKSMPSMD